MPRSREQRGVTASDHNFRVRRGLDGGEEGGRGHCSKTWSDRTQKPGIRQKEAKTECSWGAQGPRLPTEWRVAASLTVGYPSQGAESPLESLPI